MRRPSAARAVPRGGRGDTAQGGGTPHLAQPLFRRRTLLGGLAPICCVGRACACGGEPGWYQRYFAYAMHASMGTYEAAIRPTKEELFCQLLAPGPRQAGAVSGGGGGGGGGGTLRVLEVGIGTGPNLAFMAQGLGPERLPSLRLTGLDPNAAMQPYAREAAAAAGLAPGQVALVGGDAQAMPFEDGAFDAAVITLVLCSVPDPEAALREVRRVVAPGGRLALIEHVAAAPRERPLVAAGQRLLDPLQRLVADGCHLTRDTAATLARCGFDTSGLESFEVPGLGILAPHIAGVLTV